MVVKEAAALNDYENWTCLILSQCFYKAGQECIMDHICLESQYYSSVLFAVLYLQKVSQPSELIDHGS